jgi:ribosomal protein L11 methyltransferase
LIRLAVRVATADAERVLADLLELAPAGLEERELDDGRVEYVIYGAPGEVPELGTVQAAAGDVRIEVHSERVADDWAERWKAFHPPVDVAWRLRRLRVRPPWEPPAPEREVLDIVIEPGQAFGTGSHHTTRLCLQLLLEQEPGATDAMPDPAVADWGCGTGVLAIAAARLGFDPVAAVDNDPFSLEATEANAAVNGVRLATARVDLRREPGPWAPLVLANLVRPLLLEVAALMVRPPHRLIASGLLREEADEVAAAFAERGLRELDRRFASEWAALLLAHSG